MRLPVGARALRRADGRVEGVLARDLPHPAERVWAHLIAPEFLPLWLAEGRVEPRLDGFARLDFGQSGSAIDSPVTQVIPLQALDYSWSGPGEPERPLRWRLRAVGPAETRLLLSVTTPEADDPARALAGWDAHLEMLAAALEGVPIKFPFQHFQAARAALSAELIEGDVQAAM
ncbi:SRPBCC domain-containing protein [Phenylobacterium sp.]|uniref:SRPBCC domain-containing protein n=1 Tax=Phenylobacterium sp. TaxID=1871053 RepID=UPI00272FDEEB|nr:SRPBCC domain-containing protein [Phenylobacterium sp.]MDP1873140.1 SRPBCC domain-containing protein [Phenylobacterium sp.]